MNELVQSGVLNRLKFIQQVLRKHQWLMVGMFAVESLVALVSALLPYFAKLQIDFLQTRQTLGVLSGLSTPSVFAVLLLIPASLELARLVLFERIAKKLSFLFNTELRLDTERFIWQKLETLDAGFFANRRNERLLRTAFNATSAVRDFVEFLRSRLRNVITLGAIIPLLALISWQLLLLVLATTLLQLFLSDLVRKQEIAANLLLEKERDRLWKYESTLVYDFHTLKVLGAVPLFLQGYQSLTREIKTIEFQQDLKREAFRVYEWFLNNCLMVGTNLYVGFQVLQGNLSLGTFTLVVSYTLQLNGVFREVMDSFRAWKEIDLDFDKLQFFSLLKPRVILPVNGVVTAPLQQIAFKKVHFTYPSLFDEERKYLEIITSKTKGMLDKYFSYYQYELDKWKELLDEKELKNPVLKGVSIELDRGKIVALLGRNGAGKTTMTHLTMHHYEPTQGTVKLDGQPLPMYDQNWLLQQFGVIQQRPFVLYRFTVRENITLGVARVTTDQELWAVLDELGLGEKIRSFSQGLDTIIGEGNSLSGGQEQLLAVARVLLQRRPFLIFDEGMNQLDIEKENKVMSLLQEQKKHAAVLFITHRITTARKADYIYMLDEGRVAEEGTHQQLLKKKGLYAKFWHMQVVE